MANVLSLVMAVLAFAVIAAQFHYLLRLRQRGNETVPIVLAASLLGLLMCEHYLHDGGDALLAVPTAMTMAMSAFAVWRQARRRARDARAALLADVPQPRWS